MEYGNISTRHDCFNSLWSSKFLSIGHLVTRYSRFHYTFSFFTSRWYMFITVTMLFYWLLKAYQFFKHDKLAAQSLAAGELKSSVQNVYRSSNWSKIFIEYICKYWHFPLDDLAVWVTQLCVYYAYNTRKWYTSCLTHCGLVMTYGGRGLGQHWFR